MSHNKKLSSPERRQFFGQIAIGTAATIIQPGQVNAGVAPAISIDPNASPIVRADALRALGVFQGDKAFEAFVLGDISDTIERVAYKNGTTSSEIRHISFSVRDAHEKLKNLKRIPQIQMDYDSDRHRIEVLAGSMYKALSLLPVLRLYQNTHQNVVKAAQEYGQSVLKNLSILKERAADNFIRCSETEWCSEIAAGGFDLSVLIEDTEKSVDAACDYLSDIIREHDVIRLELLIAVMEGGECDILPSRDCYELLSKDDLSDADKVYLKARMLDFIITNPISTSVKGDSIFDMDRFGAAKLKFPWAFKETQTPENVAQISQVVDVVRQITSVAGTIRSGLQILGLLEAIGLSVDAEEVHNDESVSTRLALPELGETEGRMIQDALGSVEGAVIQDGVIVFEGLPLEDDEEAPELKPVNATALEIE